MKHEITKEFDFCYGHRVHNQKLNQELSIDNRCVCRHLHGHQGKIIVTLQSDRLQSGMVTDFKHLNWFKQFVDDNLDHKFIIDSNDPLFHTLLPNDPLLVQNSWGYKSVDMSIYPNIDEPMRELLEGYVIVDFVPTSENISAWLFKLIEHKMKPYCSVKQVEFKETPKTAAIYNGD